MLRILKIALGLLLFAVAIFFFYCNNLKLANDQTIRWYLELKDSLRARKLNTSLLVISTKRFKWHNDIQVRFSGAASGSRHLKSEAIDFIVFDINADGRSDMKDVEIVFGILDKQIIKNKGGIGTYKDEKSFISRQMIHIDCRGYGARW